MAEDLERDHLVLAISRDVGRYLAPMTVELDRLAGLLQSDPEAAAILLAELEAQVDRALNAMRDLSHGLFPALLFERGLAAALTSYAQHSSRPIAVEASPEARDVRLPPDQEAAGYFCCVEALRLLDSGVIEVGIQQDRLELRCGGQPDRPLGAAFCQRLLDRAEAVGGSVQFEVGTAGAQTLVVQFPLDSDVLPPEEEH
jgi:signal transduction histidine kinase